MLNDKTLSPAWLASAALIAAMVCPVSWADDRGLTLAQSRDELFGVETPKDAQAPKAPVNTFRWGGFFDQEAAYTSSAPRHWSRFVNRLQLVGQGNLGEGVKYKISGRIDADPVYMYSDFYPPAVKKDQRLDGFLRENYLDFSAGGLDFRLGRQHIVWGEVVGLFFADVVSARDTREFILPTFDILRIPQWAARAEYFKDDFHAELIWIPVRSFDNIGKPGAEFYPVGRASALPPGSASVFQEVDEPSKKLANSNYGLRLSGSAAGWDLAAFYFRSYSATPTFYRRLVNGPTPTFIFSPRPDRIWQTGGTMSKEFGSVVLRAEAIYTSGQKYSVSTLTDEDGVAAKRVFEYIVSLDFTLPRDTRLNLQAFQRHFLGGDIDIVPETGGFGVSALLSTKIGATLEPQVLVIQSLAVNDRMVRPRLNWYFQKNWTLAVGVDIFSGPATGYFGRFANRDRVYTELRRDF